MSLEIGTIACTSGLAQRIYAARVALGSVIGLAADHTALKADCFAIATAVVEEIVANGEAVVGPAVAGLQMSTGPGNPTGPSGLETGLPLR